MFQLKAWFGKFLILYKSVFRLIGQGICKKKITSFNRFVEACLKSIENIRHICSVPQWAYYYPTAPSFQWFHMYGAAYICFNCVSHLQNGKPLDGKSFNVPPITQVCSDLLRLSQPEQIWAYLCNTWQGRFAQCHTIPLDPSSLTQLSASMCTEWFPCVFFNCSSHLHNRTSSWQLSKWEGTSVYWITKHVGETELQNMRENCYRSYNGTETKWWPYFR